ncbi:hypothetical protein MSPP1_001439 [Malassezia sp. CBS 17886]|nr:hypothetical protein MSPP1_001439 [Malassezia sp. CBS 17886]
MDSLLGPFHLGQRHAHFYVTVTVHEVLNVPLLKGEFAVAWKFQHAVSSASRIGSSGLSALVHPSQDSSDASESTNASPRPAAAAPESPPRRPPVSVDTGAGSSSAAGSNAGSTRHSPSPASMSGERGPDAGAGAVPPSPASAASHDSSGISFLSSNPASNATSTTTSAAPSRASSLRHVGSTETLPHDASSARAADGTTELQRGPSEHTWGRLRALREGHGDARQPRGRLARSGSLTGTHTPPHARHSAHAVLAQTEPKGQTGVVKLDEFNANMGRKMEAVVRIPLAKADGVAGRAADGSDAPRDAGSARSVVRGSELPTLSRLQDTYLRLRVLQAHSTGDAHTSESMSVFGSARINLAAYAPRPYGAGNGHGSGSASGTVSPQMSAASSYLGSSGTGTPHFPTSRTEARQYLLDDSVSNAMIRVTVEMRFLDGPRMYRVPPIRDSMSDLVNMVPTTGGDDTVSRTMSTEADVARESGKSSAITGPNGDGLVNGLEWHYKLPVSLMYAFTATGPELVHARARRTLPDAAESDMDSSNPRVLQCNRPPAQVIDDLLAGSLGPSEDHRDPGPAVDAAAEAHTDRKRMARIRWRRVMTAIKATRSGSDSLTQRVPSSRSSTQTPRLRRDSSHDPGTEARSRTWLAHLTHPRAPHSAHKGDGVRDASSRHSLGP